MITPQDIRELSKIKLFGDDTIYSVNCRVDAGMTFIDISNLDNPGETRMQISFDKIERVVEF